MRRKLISSGTLFLAGLVATLALVIPLGAQTTPLPISVELLTPREGGVFTDDVKLIFRYKLAGNALEVISSREPSQTIVARITVQPGAQFPWHTHPGPVIVNVTQGELVYVLASDCVERSYPGGTAFIDPGRGNVHTAYNPTDGETILIATFFEIPPTGPLTIPVDAPSDCLVEGGLVAAHH
jgi:quercetin dioxygenase-like cupin family protein